MTHAGDVRTVTGAGLAPLPVQRPIPMWIGGQSPPAYRRAGRLADGWFPQVPPGPELDEARAIVEQAARERRPRSGRDRHGGPRRAGPRPASTSSSSSVGSWRDAGATHLSINTMNAGLGAVDDHLAALKSLAAVLDLG